MATMTRTGFVLEPDAQRGGFVLRIAQRKGNGSLPLGYPHRLTRDEARLLLTLLAGHFAEWFHDPDGCTTDRCPCRQRLEQEQRYERRPGL